MRKLMKFISAVGLAMALAASSQATPYVGGASFALATLPGLVAAGSGTGASLPNLVTINWTAAGAIGPVLITLAPTAAAPLSALNILLTAPGPCSFAGTPVGGACPLGGTANALVAGAPFLIVPLSGLGVAGRVGFGPYGSYIDAQSWIAATAVATINGAPMTTTVTTPGGGATIVPVADFGYDARTPGGLGTVKLVAPAGLMSTLGGNLPLFVQLTLTFVPEPGTLLLLGSGIAGLAIIGRKRMRR